MSLRVIDFLEVVRGRRRASPPAATAPARRAWRPALLRRSRGDSTDLSGRLSPPSREDLSLFLKKSGLRRHQILRILAGGDVTGHAENADDRSVGSFEALVLVPVDTHVSRPSGQNLTAPRNPNQRAPSAQDLLLHPALAFSACVGRKEVSVRSAHRLHSDSLSPILLAISAPSLHPDETASPILDCTDGRAEYSEQRVEKMPIVQEFVGRIPARAGLRIIHP